MAKVDPYDDSILRWIAYRNMFDPSRNEVRHVVLVAFSSEEEFHKFVEEERVTLEERKINGKAEEYEFIGGDLKYAGSDLRAKEVRAIVKNHRDARN